MGKVMAFFDGKKRYLLLAAFAVESIAGMMGNTDLQHVVRWLLALTGWDPADALVNAAVVAQFVASAWAIYEGVVKDIEKRRLASTTVSLPR